MGDEITECDNIENWNPIFIWKSRFELIRRLSEMLKLHEYSIMYYP